MENSSQRKSALDMDDMVDWCEKRCYHRNRRDC